MSDKPDRPEEKSSHVQRKSLSANVSKKGKRTMTAEEALISVSPGFQQLFQLWTEYTYTQAMLRMPMTANFASRFMCSLETRKIGKIPTVKSQSAANAL